MQSKFMKTPIREREVYIYYFSDGTSKTYRPGKNGVTAELIKKLHAMDDAEVYNNIKNSAPEPPESERMQRRAWNKAHPWDIRKRSWNLSLDAKVKVHGNTEDYASTLMDIFAVEEETNPYIEKMREVVATMTPKQQRVYELLYIEEFKENEVAAIMGVSTARITIIKKRIIEILKKSFHSG